MSRHVLTMLVLVGTDPGKEYISLYRSLAGIWIDPGELGVSAAGNSEGVRVYRLGFLSSPCTAGK